MPRERRDEAVVVAFEPVARATESLFLAGSIAVAVLGAACGAARTERLSGAVAEKRAIGPDLRAGDAPPRVPLADDTPMPGPSRARLDAAVAANAECERCHADVATEWRGSLHHRSDVEPAYVRSFAIEPLPFCRGCHAPESVAATEEPPSVRDLGVGCVTCHVTEEGRVLAAPKSGPEAAEHGPHEIARSSRFAAEGACGGCHEFAFPLRQPRSRGDLMQSTMAEHAESPGKALACASCHMPLDDAHKRSHAFTTSRDASVVARAVRVAAVRIDATRVRVSLTPDQLGHAFPTGDLFRRLELSAEAVGPDDMVLASAIKFLARHFGAQAGGFGRQLLSDDRVTGAGTEIVLDVGDLARGREIAWRVAYQRVAHPNGIDEASATLEGELTIASGRLPAVGPPPLAAVSRENRGKEE